MYVCIYIYISLYIYIYIHTYIHIHIHIHIKSIIAALSVTVLYATEIYTPPPINVYSVQSKIMYTVL